MSLSCLVMHHASRVIPLLACLLGLGCADLTKSYWGRRALDFGDCWDASVGFAGLVPYVRLKVTDSFVVAGGDNQTVFAFGWHGRYTAAGSEIERGEGVPFVRSREWAGAPPMITTRGAFITSREYDTSVKPAWGTQLADRYYAGLWLAWGLNVRLNFNIVEFTDFLLGVFGADILKDDAVEPPDWPATMQRPDATKHPVL